MAKNSGVEADLCQFQAVGVMLKLITQHAMQTCYFIVHVFERWRSEHAPKIGLTERLRVNLASVSQAHAPPPHLSNLRMKESLLASSYCSLSPALK